MKKQEADALMNPGLCPNCEKPLQKISKGFISKKYYLKCSSCGAIWDDAYKFLDDAEQASIEGLKKEGLQQWPFEVPIMLAPQEKVYVVRQNVGLYEGRRYSYSGSTSGISLRLAPGLWVRSGSGMGTGEIEDIMKLLDTGDLTLTDHRIAFVGSRKSIEIHFDHIVAVDVKEDGLLYIARKNKKRIEAFSMFMPNLMKEFIIMAYDENINSR